jgi:hypothetical protein
MDGCLEIEWRNPLENTFHDFLQKVRGYVNRLIAAEG